MKNKKNLARLSFYRRALMICVPVIAAGVKDTARENPCFFAVVSTLRI